MICQLRATLVGASRELRHQILPCFLLLLSTVSAVCAQTQPDDLRRRTHEALFASFLPVEELGPDKQDKALLIAAREGMWQKLHDDPRVAQLLAPFSDLRAFGPACGIDKIVNQARAPIFAQLSHDQQLQVLTKLTTCDQEFPRRLAATVRNFYLVTGYGAVQEQLTGVNIPKEAPAQYLKEHALRLPPSLLRYDDKKQEIGLQDGVLDTIVIGSGPAGSVLAHELRRGGKHVLLIDKGPLIIPGSIETRLTEALVDTRTSADGAIRIRNGMAVGGGSLVNVDLCFAPTSDAVRTKIEAWRRDRRIAKDQFTQSQVATAYAWVRKSIGTRELSESEINANNRVLWEGAKLAGMHPKLYSLNTFAPGTSPSPITDKRSALDQLLVEALQDKENSLSVLPNAEVRRVLFAEAKSGEPREAYGVEVVVHAASNDPGMVPDPNGLRMPADTKIVIRAKRIVLAAGALGSPTILLRSGVENNQIGRGVILHPSIPIMGLFDHTIDALKGTQASVFVDDKLVSDGYALEAMSAEPSYAAVMSPGSALHGFEMVKAFPNLAGFGVMLIDTVSESNRLRLDAQGQVEIEYVLSADDKNRLAKATAEAVRIMFLGGAKEVYVPTTETILDDEAKTNQLNAVVLTKPEQANLVEKNLQFIPNRTLLSSAHMQATDKMGSSAQNSVVGQDFHVWGTTALYVVDGSIFPTSIGANPMQSIYTIAKIAADELGKDK